MNGKGKATSPPPSSSPSRGVLVLVLAQISTLRMMIQRINKTTNQLHHSLRRAVHQPSATITTKTTTNILPNNYQLPSLLPPLLAVKTYNYIPSINSVVRNFATKKSNRSKRFPNQIEKNAGSSSASSLVHPSKISQRAIPKRRPRRIPIYLLSFAGAFISLNVLAAYTHTDDDYFFYLYPFPFALDAAQGPSMLPTIPDGGDIYWRDCWSHRFVWLDSHYLKECFHSMLMSSEQSTTTTTTTSRNDGLSFKRPWQKGDVVTLYNPFTESLVTKRIIGVGGDSVQVFGEYAHEYHAAITENNGDGNYFGVPNDARFPIPFCQRVLPLENEEQATTFNNSVRHSLLSKHGAAMVVVPRNHVWVEGDNPLYSTDSRHYGPLSESALRGRVVVRLWPISHDESECEPMLSSKRPLPFMNNEWLEDDRYSMRKNNNR